MSFIFQLNSYFSEVFFALPQNKWLHIYIIDRQKLLEVSGILKRYILVSFFVCLSVEACKSNCPANAFYGLILSYTHQEKKDLSQAIWFHEIEFQLTHNTLYTSFRRKDGRTEKPSRPRAFLKMERFNPC